MTERARALLPVGALGALSCAVYALGFGVAPERPATDVLPWLYGPLFAACLTAAWWIWRRPFRVPWVPVVVFGLAFRLVAVAEPPSLSSDVYRYPWDGRVQRAGLSPYTEPPAAEALAPLRDGSIHPRINRPGARTVYPPGAQLIFAALPYDVDGVRLVMVALDLLTMLLIVALLRTLALDPARVVLYAWAPLVVYEIANNGHVEAAVLPLLVGAALAHRAGRWRATGALVGGAVALKLYPALALVALARRRPLRVVGTALAVVVASYAAFAPGAGAKILGFLPEYVGPAEDHNIGLRALVEAGLAPLVSHPRAWAFGACAAFALAFAVRIWTWSAPLEQRLLALAGLFVLTLPTAFHPWYALWLVPWLCIHPRAAWLWLLAILPLSYLKYGAAGGVLPAWVVPLELGPTLLLLGYGPARVLLASRVEGVGRAPARAGLP